MNTIAYWSDIVIAIMGLISFIGMIAHGYWMVKKDFLSFNELISLWAESFRISMYRAKILAAISWAGMGVIYGFTTYYGYWLAVYVQILFFVLMAAVFLIEHQFKRQQQAV